MVHDKRFKVEASEEDAASGTIASCVIEKCGSKYSFSFFAGH